MRKFLVGVLVLAVMGGIGWLYLSSTDTSSLQESSPAAIAESILPPPVADISEAHKSKAKGLLQRIADSEQVFEEQTLFQIARSGDVYTARILSNEGLNVDAPGPNAKTPYLLATENGNIHTAVAFLEHGADPLARDAYGNSVLHLTAAANEIYTLDTMILRGVPVLLHNNASYSPLHTAAENDSVEAIILLDQFPVDFIGTPPADKIIAPITIAATSSNWRSTETFAKLGYKYLLREAAASGDLPSVKRILNEDPAQLEDGGKSTNMSPLLGAAAGNYLEVMRYLLDFGANIYAVNSDQYNAMAIAIIKDFPDTMKLLIEYGYYCNYSGLGLYQETPLMLAIRKANETAVDILLEEEVDTEAFSRLGQTALHVAVAENRMVFAKKLLEHGANPNIKSESCKGNRCIDAGSTPLHLAVSDGNEAIVSLLVDYGADVSAQRMDGNSPLHLAAEAVSPAMSKLLLAKSSNVALQNKDGATPLHLASAKGVAETITILLDAGADIKAEDNNKRQAIHLAAQNKQESALKTLLERGADIDALDELEQSPLYLALTSGHAATSKFLIEHGAKVDGLTREKRTLLYPAVQSNMNAEVAKLLEAGLEVNHKDYLDMTPLHLAAQFSDDKTVKQLIELGADPNARDRFEQTPLHFAAERGFTVVIRELILAGAEIRAENRWGQYPMHRCALSGHWGGIHYFLMADSSLSINTPDAKGNTPLHQALQSGTPALVEIMVERGADMLKRNERGFTPLSSVSQLRFATIHPQDNQKLELKKREGYKIITHFLRAALFEQMREAIFRGDTSEISRILDEEPSLVNTMIHGETLLHIAVRKGDAEMVKVLVSLGADVEIFSRTSTPMKAAEYAASNGFDEISQLLAEIPANPV